jgi:peptidase E
MKSLVKSGVAPGIESVVGQFVAPGGEDAAVRRAQIAPGIVSIDDHYAEGNVHLISNYWGLDSFLDAPLPEHQLDVAFVTTASRRYPEFGKPRRFLEAERAWLTKQQEAGRLKYTELCIAGKTADQIHSDLKNADVIFMGGGNTQYLHEQLRETGADDVIRTLVKGGTWYLGKSAGAIVAGPDIDPRGFFLDSMAEDNITDTSGLGLTEVYPLPHIDTPSIMDVEYDGKTGWQHAIEMTRRVPTAYILDNLHKADGN